MQLRLLTAAALSVALGAFCTAPAFAGSFLPVPPASFLNFHVATVPQLTQEVISDPVVRARLAGHFHWNEVQTIAFTRNDLVLTRLPSSRRVRMYCVTDQGREYSFFTHLPAGTQVFALRATGQPVLKLACGNPLISALPLPARKLTPPRMVKTRTTAGLVPIRSQGIVTVSALPTAMFADLGPFGEPAIVQVGAAPATLLASRIPAALFAPLALFGLSRSHSSPGVGAIAPGIPGSPTPGPAPSPAPEPSAPVALSVFFLVALGLIARRRLSKPERIEIS